MIKTIGMTELATMEGYALIDVREQDEWDAGHIPGAIHIPLSELMENPASFERPENDICVVYCKGGVRSARAIEILQAYGHDGLQNLTGGYMAWQAAQ